MQRVSIIDRKLRAWVAMEKQTAKTATSRLLWVMTISTALILSYAPGWALEKQQKEIIVQGNNVAISRQFADEARKSNDIILSTVAIKARVDKAGVLTGYQLVQIDKGSPVERMGLKAGDVVTTINDVPAKEFETKRQTLDAASKFDVTIIRKSKQLRMKFEIR
jgi:hypothetical protein